MIVPIAIAWQESSDFHPKSANEAAEMIGMAVSSTSGRPAKERPPYANLADLYSGRNETDRHSKALFGPNYARLQHVKEQYDPDQVFSRWFAVKPAA